MEDYPTFLHNKVCDFTAVILSKVCTDVYAEPTLQPGIINKNISRRRTERLNAII